jgi:diguanylate cyclase
MQDNQKKPEQQSPADIAREAFRRLAARRIAPTPDAYREIYEEIAGTKEESSAEAILADFARSLAKSSSDIARFAPQLTQALKDRDWQIYGIHLKRLVERHLLPEPPVIEKTPQAATQSILLVDPVETPAAKSIPLVDPLDRPSVATKSIPLVEPAQEAPTETRSIALVDPVDPAESVAEPSRVDLVEATMPAFSPGKQSRILREMLVRTLKVPVSSLLYGAPELAAEAERLAQIIDYARTEETLNEAAANLKQLCFKIELKNGDMAEEQELLIRLFRLLIENVSELVEDDAWLSGQIAVVQNLLAGPINYVALMDATRSLKEVIYKQSLLKHSLSEAKRTLKNMMLTFIERLDAVASSTDDYQGKVGKYSEKISQAKHIGQLHDILDQVMQQTRTVHTETRRSLDEMVAARNEAQAAESRVLQMQSELEQLSELVREDQLTGSLNRRGLDDVLDREIARSERRNSPLCVAMLDLDDFKRINDTLGHSGGDQALVHLVRVVKDTLRSMDVIARFGGEEFMIVLPDTPLAEAGQTVTRVQRELTKRIFMHNNEKILMTFSAGIALRKPGEEQAALIQRADEAAYKAKRAGKNRVVTAE